MHMMLVAWWLWFWKGKKRYIFFSFKKFCRSCTCRVIPFFYIGNANMNFKESIWIMLWFGVEVQMIRLTFRKKLCFDWIMLLYNLCIFGGFFNHLMCEAGFGILQVSDVLIIWWVCTPGVICHFIFFWACYMLMCISTKK